MSTNETMQDLHKMIGIIELKAPLDSKDTLHCQTDYSPVEWCINRQHGASTLVTIHEAQNHICMAAIEWMSRRVETLAVWHITDAPWEVTWVDGKGTGNVKGPTLLDALHATVKAIKESKDCGDIEKPYRQQLVAWTDAAKAETVEESKDAEGD